jgi:hypothetical protein
MKTPAKCKLNIANQLMLQMTTYADNEDKLSNRSCTTSTNEDILIK